MRLVDLHFYFKCDWLIELSDNKLSNNKLSDNNLASEEIVIFMISTLNVLQKLDVCCKGISGQKLKPPIPRLPVNVLKAASNLSVNMH